MDDKQLQSDLILLIRQAEMTKAQLETLLYLCVELGRKVGLQIVDPSQLAPAPAGPPSKSPKPSEPSAESAKGAKPASLPRGQ